MESGGWRVGKRFISVQDDGMDTMNMYMMPSAHEGYLSSA
jgi:hypothetical protein